jgi:hypothetical protein
MRRLDIYSEYTLKSTFMNVLYKIEIQLDVEFLLIFKKYTHVTILKILLTRNLTLLYYLLTTIL